MCVIKSNDNRCVQGKLQDELDDDDDDWGLRANDISHRGREALSQLRHIILHVRHALLVTSAMS